MNNKEFRLLNYISIYPDGISKKGYILKKWMGSSNGAKEIEKEFNDDAASPIHFGMVERVAPPFFNRDNTNREDTNFHTTHNGESVYIFKIIFPTNDIKDSVRTDTYIGEYLYKPTAKGAELLLKIHLINGGEKDLHRVAEIRRQLSEEGFTDPEMFDGHEKL